MAGFQFGNVIGSSLASGDNYNRWGTDDTETQRLLARYPAAASDNGSTFDWEAAYASQDREMDGEKRPWRPREGNGDNSRLELSDYRSASGIDSPTMDTREPNGRLQAAEATMAAILETRQQIAYQQAKDAGRLRTLAGSPIEPVQGITAVDLSLSSAGASLQDIQPLPALSFQEVNDQRVLAGTYDRNQQIGQAWSDGRYGDVWRHLNFEASDAGKAAVQARLFPQVSPGMARIDQMLNSPVGAILYGASRWAGASQSTQDALLTTGGILEGVGGGLVGVRTPGRVSQQGPLARVRTGDAPRRGVVEFGGLEVRAVRDLSHVDVGTLRAMQQYGFAAKDINGNSLVLHHHRQNPAGPIIEMPGVNHKIGNPAQHPFGNTKGAGLTAEQREDFNQWRVDYWKWRAAQELLRREIP